MRALLALDLDSTLLDSAPGFVRINNPFFDTEITQDEYQEHWDETAWRSKYTEAEWVLRQGIEWADYALGLKFYRDLPAMPGAREALLELSRLGVGFRIVTSRRREFTDDSLWNLNEIFPEIGFSRETYFCTDAYAGDRVTSLAHKTTKGELLSRLGVDALVDDQPKHVISALLHGVPAIWFGEQQEEVLNDNRGLIPFRGVDWATSERKIRRILRL